MDVDRLYELFCEHRVGQDLKDEASREALALRLRQAYLQQTGLQIDVLDVDCVVQEFLDAAVEERGADGGPESAVSADAAAATAFLYFDAVGAVSTADGELVGRIFVEPGRDLMGVRGVFSLEALETDPGEPAPCQQAPRQQAPRRDLHVAFDQDIPSPPRRQRPPLCVDDKPGKSEAECIKQLQHLRGLPQPEQRSAQWYAMREQRLTASDLAGAIGESKYDKPFDILLKKLGAGKPFTGNATTEWGVKYEAVATAVYELRNSVRVEEFGLLPHPEIPYLGASPDGIVSDSPRGAVQPGVLVEIKASALTVTLTLTLLRGSWRAPVLAPAH